MRVGRINEQAIRDLARAQEVDASLRAGANRVLAEARREAPVRTGRLRRSLTVVKVGNEYRVGWNPAIAPYGPLVEGGTNDTRAQPHLVPAARKAR
jgi:HK97 gp10 family phage protein